MKKKSRSIKNGKYNATYRFRCYSELQSRAERAARTRGFGNAADIGREGVTKLVEAEEKRLGIPPLEAVA